MENNSVHLIGIVKRGAKAGNNGKGGQVLDFALQVTDPNTGRYDIFDCRLTEISDAMEQLEGFVEEGEQLEIMGHLVKRTSTESQRIAGVWIDVRSTATVVYVDSIVEED